MTIAAVFHFPRNSRMAIIGLPPLEHIRYISYRHAKQASITKTLDECTQDIIFILPNIIDEFR